MKKAVKKRTTEESFKVIGDKFSEATLNKIAIAILFILPLIYFAPFLSGSKMIAGSDWLLGAPNASWAASYIKSYHSIPMWRPHFFGGLPAISSPSGGPFGLTPLLRLIFPIHITLTYSFVIYLFLAGLGTYLYLKELKMSTYVALLGGIIYMFAGNLMSTPYGGHPSRCGAAALFPLSLLFLHKGLSYKRLPYFLFAGAIVGFSFHETHFQMVYYSLIFAGFYTLFWLIWHRKKNGWKQNSKLIGFGALGIILMVGLVAVLWLPVYKTLSTGGRGITKGYEYATSWAMPTSELLDLLVPDFSGLLNNYWGGNYFKLHTEYLGILPLLLFGIAIIWRWKKDKFVRFFTGTTIVTVIFALGEHTPLYRIPYYLLPGIKKFRGPSMVFYLTAFGIAVLAALGIQALLEMQNAKRKMKNEKGNLAIYLSAVFCAVAIFAIYCSVGRESVLSFLKGHFQPTLLANYGPGLTQQKLQNLYQNYPNFIGGLGKALLLIAINSVLILLLFTKKLKLGIFTLIAISVLLLDTWSIEKKFLKDVPPPNKYYAADGVANFLKRDKSHYRVFPLYYEHAQDSYLIYYNIYSLGGYVPNPLQRYQDLIGAGTSVMFTPPNLVKYRNILDILNAKYVIDVWIPEDLSQYDEKTQKKIENFKINFERRWNINWEDAHKGLELAYKDRYGHAVYKNNTAFSRAWIAHEFEVLPKEQVIEELKKTDFNPRTTVLLEEKPGLEIRNPKSEIRNHEGVRIVEYTANKIICEAILTSPGFLVLSENWHPDWKAYVDGKETKIYIADYTLRSVYLDKGKHTVEFVYKSRPFEMGAVISFLSFLLLLGTIVFWVKSQKIEDHTKD